jgi:hypothetical protein
VSSWTSTYGRACTFLKELTLPGISVEQRPARRIEHSGPSSAQIIDTVTLPISSKKIVYGFNSYVSLKLVHRILVVGRRRRNVAYSLSIVTFVSGTTWTKLNALD